MLLDFLNFVQLCLFLTIDSARNLRANCFLLLKLSFFALPPGCGNARLCGPLSSLCFLLRMPQRVGPA